MCGIVARYKNQSRKTVQRSEIPRNKEWEELNSMLKAKQSVQFYMSRYANPSFKQLLQVNADEFSQREGALLRKSPA